MQAIWVLVIVLYLSIASLTVGHGTAHLVHRWLLKDGRYALLSGAPPAVDRSREATKNVSVGNSAVSTGALLQQDSAPLPNLESGSRDETQQGVAHLETLQTKQGSRMTQPAEQAAWQLPDRVLLPAPDFGTSTDAAFRDTSSDRNSDGSPSQGGISFAARGASRADGESVPVDSEAGQSQGVVNQTRGGGGNEGSRQRQSLKGNEELLLGSREMHRRTGEGPSLEQAHSANKMRCVYPKLIAFFSRSHSKNLTYIPFLMDIPSRF